jgi:carboxypeptidase Taq
METSKSQALEQAYAELLEQLGKISDLGLAAAALEWDQETMMPEAGADARATMLATLSGVHHQMSTSKKTRQLLERVEAEALAAGPQHPYNNPDSDQFALLREARLTYDAASQLPGEFVAKCSELKSQAQCKWAEARSTNNFELFRPYLEQIFAEAKEKAEYQGYDEHPYDALLQDFEPGMTTAELRRIFSDLKPRLVKLLAAISNSKVAINTEILRRGYPVRAQLAFCRQLLQEIGLSADGSRLDAAEHAFMIPVAAPHDVRLTTKIKRYFLSSALFSSIHEGGHALFEKGIAPRFARTPLGYINSMALHESQSRLYENLIGRSHEFWQHQFPRLQKRFPKQLADENLETFYQAINKVSPSFIRVEADEVTYGLHIILRFELEVDIIEGKVEVADLPQVWNQRFKEMFGIEPPTDREGVLQDVHWSCGSIGYFPTYALGNLIGAAVFKQAKVEIPELINQVAVGNYAPLRQWLASNIHQYGCKYSPAQLVQRITGEAISGDAFMAYLEEKYGRLYSLNG